ncbi:MAG: copper chaperone PCu(A)C [Thermodesulfobacteriota bacterium]
MVLKLIITFSLAIKFVAASNAGAQIVVSDAWIRELPPGPSVTAGYMVIENLGNNDDKLTGINASFAGHAGIHTTQIDNNGIARTNMIQELVIPAGKKVVLEPGATHIMLTGITEPIKKDDTIKLELMFERAGRKEIYVKVKDLSGN